MDFIVAKNISFGVKTEIETNRLHGFELITSILKVFNVVFNIDQYSNFSLLTMIRVKTLSSCIDN